jgi:hypothetical protein
MLKHHRTISFLVPCLAALAIRAEAATPKIFSTLMNSAQNRITVSGQGFSLSAPAPLWSSRTIVR